MYNKEQKELADIIINFLNKSDTIFYALFLSEINKNFSTSIPTACIATHTKSRSNQMLFNPSFWNNLKKSEQSYLVLHELKHFIEMHYIYTLDFGWDDEIANIAFDLSINSSLNDFANKLRVKNVEIKMPEGGLEPKIYPEFNFLELQSSKYYYDILKQKKEEKQKTGSSGSSLFDKQMDNKEDLHPTWKDITKDMSEAEKEVLKRELQGTIEKIAKETEEAKGNLPKDIEKILRQDYTKAMPVVPWNLLLRRFIGSTVDTVVTSTRKRPNLRFEGAPSNKYKTKVSLMFASDSSGSVSTIDLEKCWKELDNVYNAGGNVFYASWDGDCNTPVLYKGKHDKNIARTKSGGTIIDSAVEMINSTYKKNNYNLGIITTDGYIGGISVKCKIPLLLIITPNGTTAFNNPYNYKIVKMN